MGVPEEIRKVPRPPNTVVVENKCEGPKHYALCGDWDFLKL